MEEEAEAEEDDTLAYLTPPVEPWLFDLEGGVTPLLQVGLSAPASRIFLKKEHVVSIVVDLLVLKIDQRRSGGEHVYLRRAGACCRLRGGG